MRMSAWLIAVAVFINATASVLAADSSFVPGQTYFGRNQYIEYYAGNLPYILTVPHGGQLEPAEIPDRTYGTTSYDINTQEVAREFIAAVVARTGKHPHVVICRLSRKKLDANRDSVEGAQGNPSALQAWQEWHAFIDSARKAVTAAYGKGIYVDLHGHGHTIQRLELGYLLSAAQLALSDISLDNSPSITASSSVRALASSSPGLLSGILRGPRSLGTYFENRGYPAVPSSMQPKPGSDPYFTGGYNTERHGSMSGGTIDAVQIETNYTGVRDTDTNRKRYAATIAEILDSYTRVHYFGLPLANAQLLINEVMFDIPRDEATTVAVEGDANGDGVRGVRGDEFVEIVNAGTVPVALGNYQLLERDMKPVFTFPANTVLSPGQYAVVFGGVGPAGFGASLPASAKYFAARPGQADSGFYASSSKTNLLTAGDNVVLLYPPTNEVMDEVCWGSALPRTVRGKKLIAPNTVNGDSIAGAIAQAVTRSPDITGLWTTHLSLGSGKIPCSPGQSGSILSAVDMSREEIPQTLSLGQNYPNPFNPTTLIEYTVGGTSLPAMPAGRQAGQAGGQGLGVRSVRLAVFDLLGREVAVLVNEQQAPGSYTAPFDGTGSASGVYVYRLTVGNRSVSKTMVMMR